MSRYIEVDALIPKINECVNGHYITDFDAVATILDAPSIDIVICKECEHWSRTFSICCIDEAYPIIRNENDFCSYGERNEQC